jgi:hypothetical protein
LLAGTGCSTIMAAEGTGGKEREKKEDKKSTTVSSPAFVSVASSLLDDPRYRRGERTARGGQEDVRSREEVRERKKERRHRREKEGGEERWSRDDARIARDYETEPARAESQLERKAKRSRKIDDETHRKETAAILPRSLATPLRKKGKKP